MKYLIWAGVSIPYIFLYDLDWYASKWFMGLSFCAILFSIEVSRRVHWSVFAPVCITLLSSLWYCESELHKYLVMSGSDQAAIRQFTARSGLCFAIMVSVFAMIRTKYLITIVEALGGLCLLNSLFSLWQYIFGQYIGGFLGNESMNACLIAVTYPFLIMYGDYNKKFPLNSRFTSLVLELVCLFAPIAAVLLVGSHMATISLVIVFLSFMWARGLVRIRNAAILILAGFGGAFLAAPELFDFKNITSGRLSLWKVVMGTWADKGDILFGQGIGSSYSLIQAIQVDNNHTNKEMFFWIFSDWLQTVFELGLVGFLAYSVMFVFALLHTRNRPWIFASLCGWLFIAMGNYPARAMLHALTGILIVAVAFRLED